MDTLSAFAKGQANRDKEAMVFDWDKAARLIVEHAATEAGAGLRGDWEYTGGTIFTNGAPVKEPHTYLSSTWAVPEIEINGTMYDCYRMESELPGWHSDTVWPESSLKILADAVKAEER